MTAHAVGDDEQSRGIVRSKAVFILRSYAADIGVGVKLPPYMFGQVRDVPEGVHSMQSVHPIVGRRSVEVQRHNLYPNLSSDKGGAALRAEFAVLSRRV